MKKTVGLGLVLASALTFSMSAFADDDVCVVQVAKVLHDAPQVQKDVEKLKAQFKKDQDALQAKQKTLEAAMKDFKKNEAVMSAADKEKAEKSIADQRQAAIQEVTTFQQKLSAAQKSMMDVVFKDLNGVIQSVAKKQECEVVLDSQFVLYAVEKRDVTAAVEKAFNDKK